MLSAVPLCCGVGLGGGGTSSSVNYYCSGVLRQKKSLERVESGYRTLDDGVWCGVWCGVVWCGVVW